MINNGVYESLSTKFSDRIDKYNLYFDPISKLPPLNKLINEFRKQKGLNLSKSQIEILSVLANNEDINISTTSRMTGLTLAVAMYLAVELCCGRRIMIISNNTHNNQHLISLIRIIIFNYIFNFEYFVIKYDDIAVTVDSLRTTNGGAIITCSDDWRNVNLINKGNGFDILFLNNSKYIGFGAEIGGFINMCMNRDFQFIVDSSNFPYLSDYFEMMRKEIKTVNCDERILNPHLI